MWHSNLTVGHMQVFATVTHVYRVRGLGQHAPVRKLLITNHPTRTVACPPIAKKQEIKSSIIAHHLPTRFDSVSFFLRFLVQQEQCTFERRATKIGLVTLPSPVPPPLPSPSSLPTPWDTAYANVHSTLHAHFVSSGKTHWRGNRRCA